MNSAVNTFRIEMRIKLEILVKQRFLRKNSTASISSYFQTIITIIIIILILLLLLLIIITTYG